MKTKTTTQTDTTMITSTERATDKVPHKTYSSMDEMLAHDFEDMKKIATTPTPAKKTPAYPDPRQALRDIEAHSKSPKDVIAKLDAQEAAEKEAEEFASSHNISEITIFNAETHPEFGNIRTLTIDGEPWFVGKDVCAVFNDKNHNRSLGRIDSGDKISLPIKDSLNRTQKAVFVNESGLYSLLFSMQPQKANNDGVSDAYPIEIQQRIEKLHQFKHWVTAEVLPTIRKTGGYINQGQEDLFVDTYLPFLDENYKNLFKLNLQVIDQLNGKLRKQNIIIETQKQDIKDFQDAIATYTKDVPLATKRMLINRLIRFPGTNFGLRWMVLYREFDNVYHMNVKARMNKYNATHTPMCKSQMEFIDLHLGMINELFDLAVKLYKSDYEALIQQMYDAREIDFDSIA